jgi:hypothetical protein
VLLAAAGRLACNQLGGLSIQEQLS